jgi:hypothetical protein
MRLVIGALVGAVLGGAGVLGHGLLQKRADPCLERCGDGTACESGRCVPSGVPVAAAERSRGKRRRPRPSAGAPERESLRRVSAADLKPTSEGPSLRGTDRVDLTGDSDAAGRELSTEEIDAKVRSSDDKIVACIDRARKDFDLDRGRVVVGFRIERSGAVEKVRVSAPALLLRNGLHECIRGVVRSLRFPATSRALVMSYPFELR